MVSSGNEGCECWLVFEGCQLQKVDAVSTRAHERKGNVRVGGGDRRCVSSKTDHRSGPRFLAWPHRSLAAQQLGVDGAMTREMGRPHQSEGIAAQARAAPPGDTLRDGAGIGADLPPYQTANLDQLSKLLCHVGNCSRGKPPTPTSDARGAVMRVTTVCVGSGGCGSGKGAGCSARS